MKKFLKWAGISLAGLLVLGTVIAVAAPAEPETKVKTVVKPDRAVVAENEELKAENAEYWGKITRLEDRVTDLKGQLKEERQNVRDLEAAQVAAPAPEAPVEDDGAGASTIEDGTWEVGSDIAAGTYRAPGGDDCYWEIRTSAHSGDSLDEILENGVMESNPTVTISDGQWFETDSCGSWTGV
jgi:hypothetical protein